MTQAKHHLILIALYALSAPVVLSTLERLVFVFQSHSDLPIVDLRYASHPWITVAHLIPGLVFFLIAPLQFHQSVRRQRILHRSLGLMFILTGVLSSLGVMWMVIAFPAVGGFLTQVVTFAMTLAMIALMGLAWRAAQQRRILRHQTAMIRAYAIGLTVSVARILIDMAEYFFDIPFEQSFTVCSGIALMINIIVTEQLILPRLRTSAPSRPPN